VCVCIYIKTGRVSTGFTRVDRVPGRPAWSTGFRRANSPAGFCLDPDRSQARVGRVPGRPAGPVRVSKLWSKRAAGAATIVEDELELVATIVDKRAREAVMDAYK
jgi:hypothetical protein